jgi:preprotein translocase subunit SecG
MSILSTIAVVIQVLSAIGVIVLVLLQQGKGADMGAAFGSGSSGSLFGATGSANFLSRMTAVLATVFFVSTLALAFFANSRTQTRAPTSVMDAVKTPAPATPDPAGAASIPGAPASGGGVPASPTQTAPGVDTLQKNEGANAIPK